MPEKPVRSVRCLLADQSLDITKQPGGRVAVTVPELNRYEIVVFEY